MRISFKSDWLNPMLVRDLRQVLRSRVFTMVFLLLQCGMAFFVVLGVSSSEESEVSSILHTILWGGLIIFYFMLMPAIALSSLVPEFSDNRLDLLKLTQMSARSLMVGKWLSFCAQGAMVAVSLLPYMVLSYYSGGVELGSELGSMAAMLAASSLLIGVCLAVSSMNSRIVRGLLTLVFIFSFFGSFIGLSNVFMGRGGGGIGAFSMPIGNSGYFLAVAILGIIGSAALWLCMEFGAARLAPVSENHDTTQRLLLPLLCMFAFGFLAELDTRGGRTSFMIDGILAPMLVCVLILIVWILIQAMATEPSPYPDTYRFYMRGGAWRRWLGRLVLYPGWPSAVFLILVMTILFLGFGNLLLLQNRTYNFNFPNFFMYCFVIPAGLMFPQVIGVELRRTRLSPSNRYLFIVGICIIVMIGCLLFANVRGGASIQQFYLAFACLLPPNALLLLPTVDWDLPERYFAIGAAVATGLPTIIIGVKRAIQYWPTFTEVERRAAALNEEAKFAKTAPLFEAKVAAPVTTNSGLDKPTH